MTIADYSVCAFMFSTTFNDFNYNKELQVMFIDILKTYPKLSAYMKRMKEKFKDYLANRAPKPF